MEIENTRSLHQNVLQALEICRPYLRADGGDIQLVNIRENRIVELRFEGTCCKCPLSPLTLRAGIERTIMHWAPEVARVECVKP